MLQRHWSYVRQDNVNMRDALRTFQNRLPLKKMENKQNDPVELIYKSYSYQGDRNCPMWMIVAMGFLALLALFAALFSVFTIMRR